MLNPASKDHGNDPHRPPANFSDLPTELRLQIYEHVLPGPEYVFIFKESEEFRKKVPTSIFANQLRHKNIQIRPMLLLNQEARQVAQRYSVINHAHTSQIFYFDVKQDTLLLESDIRVIRSEYLKRNYEVPLLGFEHVQKFAIFFYYIV
ncbi:hypothetical protein HYALB_00002120 [Hymenoscyphus albidus]|uniref:2EXR domain-containing protein n=1 Tax=Hymenoscyphus albidus TaxID=595503 RepID=A0A9N9Q7E2_9HELO|nr:hypothetical protein HYALB_00002120 [Hymenoscyphus albidus]